jgi:DNA polymerase III epsilon subunit-like protein
MSHKLIIFDTETGGVGINAAQKWSIIQLGAIVHDTANPGGGPTFTCVINEELADVPLSLDPDAMKVNGFTIERIREEGLSPVVAVAAFLRWAWYHFPASLAGTDRIPLGGHNVGYDTHFLYRLFRLAGLPDLYDDVFSYRTMDTASIARALIDAGVVPLQDPKSHSLFAHFDCAPTKPHDALSDAIATAQLYAQLLSLLAPKPVS